MLMNVFNANFQIKFGDAIIKCQGSAKYLGISFTSTKEGPMLGINLKEFSVSIRKRTYLLSILRKKIPEKIVRIIHAN